MANRKKTKKRQHNSNKRKLGILRFVDPTIIVFVILALILCSNMLSYFFKPHVKVYEVNEGSIATDYTYRGFAIRNEQVVSAEQSGYITYYARDLEKAGAQTTVYSIDETGQILEILSDDSVASTSLSKEQMMDLNKDVTTFYDNYSNMNFHEVYKFKQNIEIATLQLIQQTLIENSNQNQENTSFHVFKSPIDGIVSYAIDGYENVTLNDVTSQMLSEDSYSAYSSQDLNSQTLVKTGDNIFKVITNDEWSVVIKTDEAIANKLLEEEYVKVYFKKDKTSIYGKVSTWKKDQDVFVAFSFTNSMIRFAQDRYIDISFEIDDISGLKVPKTSIGENELYAIDKSFLVTGSAGNLDSCYVESYNENGEAETKTVELDIKYETDDTVYLDLNGDITAGVTIRAGGTTQERMTVGKTEKIKGVYLYNTAEPIFYPINILVDDDEYCIISSKTKNGISKYDYIVLNSDLVE